MSETSTDVMEAATAAMQEKDWAEARRLLAPVVAESSRGVGAFHLARAELELGRPEVAAPLVAAFTAWRPKHVGARVLAARVHLATGQLDAAESHAMTARELDPARPGVPRLLERIATARGQADLDRLIEVVDAGYLAARDTGPTPELLAAARDLASTEPDASWARDRRQATVAYFHFSGDPERALRNYDPHLIDVSTQFDYVTWPKRIQEYVRGRSVLDVGCGFGGFGMGFLIAGAERYAGLDPAMELDSTKAKNKRVRRWADMGTTPRQIAESLPAIRLFQTSSEDMALEETFGAIALHNVTEHLIELDEVLRGLTRLCEPDTDVVFHHHNFYCWNGHHQPPNQPEQIDEANPRHREVQDWRHIEMVPELPPDHYMMTHLNRVRLDELREVTERYFDIVRWEEIPSSESTRARLTPQVVDRVRRVVPDITERELTVNTVLAVARVRSG